MLIKTMQYLLSEVQNRNSSIPGEAKSFNSIQDLVNHLQKINKDKQLLIGDKLTDADTLKEILYERLSTVSIRVSEGEKKWIITAY